MAHESFLKLNASGDLLVTSPGNLLLVHTHDVTHGGGSMGGVKKPLPKRIEIISYPVEGNLLVEENLKMAGLLMRKETQQIGGFLKQKEIVEAVGNLSVYESFKLNGQLKTIIRKEIVESRDSKLEEKENLSYYKLLMDIIDDL